MRLKWLFWGCIISYNGRLSLTVADDGVGLDGSPARADSGGSGIGLSNTRARLETLYGGGASLQVEAGEVAGVRVSIELPVQLPIEPPRVLLSEETSAA